MRGSVESGAPFGILTTYFRDLVEHAMQCGWEAYVFSPRDVLRQRRVIWGWKRKNGTWKRAFVPTPQIGYLRSNTFTPADKKVFLWLRDEVGTQFINQPEVEEIVFDYWRLIQIGLSHPTLIGRIPDSILLRGDLSLTETMKLDSHYLVRPRFALRQGAAEITRFEDTFHVRYEYKNSIIDEDFNSVVQLRDSLHVHFGDAIIQHLPKLFRVENCIIGIRSFWQRDRSGRWKENFSILRVSQPSNHTDQLATVGLLERYLPFLSRSLKSQMEAVRYQIINISRTFVELIDQRGHGASELSVDLLITREKQVILAGVSTLGGMYALKKIQIPELRHKVMSTTLNYATTLYEQTHVTPIGVSEVNSTPTQIHQTALDAS